MIKYAVGNSTFNKLADAVRQSLHGKGRVIPILPKGKAAKKINPAKLLEDAFAAIDQEKAFQILEKRNGKR